MMKKIITALLMVMSAHAMAEGVNSTGMASVVGTPAASLAVTKVTSPLALLKFGGVLHCGYMAPKTATGIVYFIGYIANTKKSQLRVLQLTDKEVAAVHPTSSKIMFNRKVADSEMSFTYNPSAGAVWQFRFVNTDYTFDPRSGVVTKII